MIQKKKVKMTLMKCDEFNDFCITITVKNVIKFAFLQFTLLTVLKSYIKVRFYVRNPPSLEINAITQKCRH